MNEALAHMSHGRVSPIASTLNSNWESISSTQQAYYLWKVGQVLNEVLTTIAPNQEEKVLEALKRSFMDTTLAKKGNKSRACAVKEEVTTNQLSILLRVYHKAENRQTRLQILSMFAKHFSKKELREMIPGLVNGRSIKPVAMLQKKDQDNQWCLSQLNEHALIW